MIDPNDDLGTAKRPFRVVAVIPVHERLELLPLTISRLLKKNGLDRVICVGDGLKEKAICLEAGAMWVHHQNKPLGAKWNAGFKAARELKPDAILFVGSSDWVCNDWVTTMKPYLDQHQIVGVPGMHLIDVRRNQLRACNWKGYVGVRATETIGIGRMISASLLDKLGWQPFNDLKDHSMDRAMKDKCAAVGFNDFFVRDRRLVCVSVSVPEKWKNLHDFEAHWDGRIPSEKIFDVQDFIDTNHFPEANDLQRAIQ
jgi:glycosyltransferase involved in cell wall biosynthesis